MLYQWVMAAHVCGVLLWFAGALITLHVLRVSQRASSASSGGSAQDFQSLEGPAGRILDAGAGLALAAGLYLLFENLAILRGAGFMHAKLTLVVALLGVHGFLRVRLKKFRTGQSRTLPSWAEPAVLGIFFAIVVLIIARPF
jgi:putative membrane protein